MSTVPVKSFQEMFPEAHNEFAAKFKLYLKYVLKTEEDAAAGTDGIAASGAASVVNPVPLGTKEPLWILNKDAAGFPLLDAAVINNNGREDLRDQQKIVRSFLVNHYSTSDIIHHLF
jgi:hypothetical protein